MRLFESALISVALASALVMAEEEDVLSEMGHPGLIEMMKTDAARGVLTGAVKRYNEDLDPSKAIFAIHSHAHVVSELVVWVVWNNAGLLGGFVFPNREDPQLIAIHLTSESHDVEKITKRIERISEVIATNRKELAKGFLDYSRLWDVRIRGKVNPELEDFRISFPENENSELHKEIKSDLDELIKEMVKIAQDKKIEPIPIK